MPALNRPLAALAVVVGLLGAAPAAQAMPFTGMASVAGSRIQHADFRGGEQASDLLVQVRDGCGRGWRVNRWGRCVPNRAGPRRYYRPGGYYRPGVYYRPPVYYGRPWHRPHYGYGPRPWHRGW